MTSEAPGWHSVWYCAERYRIVGVYFARGPNGQRPLHYLLVPDPVDLSDRKTWVTAAASGNGGNGGRHRGDQLVRRAVQRP